MFYKYFFFITLISLSMSCQNKQKLNENKSSNYNDAIIGTYYIDFTCELEGNKFNPIKGYNCMVVQFLPSMYSIYYDDWNKSKPEVIKYQINEKNSKKIISLDINEVWVDYFEIVNDYELIDLLSTDKNRVVKYIKMK